MTKVDPLVVLLVLTVSIPAGGQQYAPLESRDAVLTRARVWQRVDTPILDLYRGPSAPDAFEPGATVTCDYVARDFEGASPKFACRLPDGDELKVKYGGTNGEVYAEVIATRLLWALGFGADRMYSVRVICRACPQEIGGIQRANGDRVVDPAAVERKAPGREIGSWSWDELDAVDEAKGGASQAERDALKLLAVLLQHSDSKPDNQRLLCLAESDAGVCDTPLLMMQDVGVTFGRANRFNQQPRGSVNLAEWSRIPVWKEGGRCVGRLSGSITGTLENPVIGEQGRAFLGGLLMQLSDQQLYDMFRAARVHLRPRAPERGRSGFATIDEWVDAFKQKRAQIVERRCL